MLPRITRRDFIKGCALSIGAFGLKNLFRYIFSSETALAKLGYFKEAMYYEKVDEETVRCVLCPNHCLLKNGQRSFCRVREPSGGKLYSLVYELPCSVHIDPIEKKPIFHMLPGSRVFSIATAGCNLRCKFCQNWQISQQPPEQTINTHLPCEEIAVQALKSGCRSVAYTYSEPNVFYEYMFDTARIVKSYGLKNVWVTGGFINPEPVKNLSTVIDAANMDLKGFSDKYLKEVCNERLEPLLTAIRLSKEFGIWVEITNLVIPTLNDDMGMIKEMCGWIRDTLGTDVPLHFSRFWPMYKLKNLPPTPVDTLHKAREIAIGEGLNYVYIGNVPGDPGNNTYCPNCKKLIIGRKGYMILENNLQGSRCKFCKHQIAGIWT